MTLDIQHATSLGNGGSRMQYQGIYCCKKSFMLNGLIHNVVHLASEIRPVNVHLRRMIYYLTVLSYIFSWLIFNNIFLRIYVV